MNILAKTRQFFFWNVLSRPFAHLILKQKYHFKINPESDQFPKPPFIVVANHGTFFDPWIIGCHSKYALSIMVNDDGFTGKSISSWYLRNIGAFPKKKGSSDYKAMKTALSLLNQKRPVFIFPEGQTTWDGETQPLYRGLEKIVKKVKCPLVMVKLQGNFLTKPWWASSLRNGSILISMKVMTAHEIDSITTDNLFEIIKHYLYQNDIKDPRNSTVPFEGDRCAEGLELFVWICMHCNHEDTIVTDRNTITCTHCKNSWAIDAHCRLSTTTSASTLTDLWEWAQMHKKEVIARIEQKHSVLTKTEKVTLIVEGESGKFVPQCTGTLTLTPNELLFDSNNVQTKWDVAIIKEFVIQKKNIFEFRSNSQVVRFMFDKNSPMKWIYYLRYMNNFQQCEQQGYY